MIPNGSKDSIIIESHLDAQSIQAPVELGQRLGYASVLCAGEEIGQIELVASETCSRSGWLAFLNILKIIFTSKVFLVIVAIIIVIIGALVLFSIHDTRRRRRLFNSKMRNK